MKILMVLTSHDKLGNTGRKTGFWLEEFAAPYYVFKETGAEIVVASPKGGQPPLDPKSNEPNFQTELTRRFETDAAAIERLDGDSWLQGVHRRSEHDEKENHCAHPEGNRNDMNQRGEQFQGEHRIDFAAFSALVAAAQIRKNERNHA